MSHDPDQPETKEIKPNLTREQVEAHIRGEGNLKLVEMKDLLKGKSESCVDGRKSIDENEEAEGIIGTLGGNAGELVLALAAAEQTSEEQLDLNDMDEILEKYLEASGKFYMHTDEHALEHAGVDPKDVLNPSEEQKEELLDKLTTADNIGCGHLNWMLKDSENYGVRPELLQAAIKSIFKAAWSGKDVELEVLQGDHEEGAVVQIVVDEEISDETKIPTIKPIVDGVQMFVNHPQAASFMRMEIGEVMAGITGLNIDISDFNKKTKELAEQQLTATLGHLADGKPVYTAHFKDGVLDRVE